MSVSDIIFISRSRLWRYFAKLAAMAICPRAIISAAYARAASIEPYAMPLLCKGRGVSARFSLYYAICAKNEPRTAQRRYPTDIPYSPPHAKPIVKQKKVATGYPNHRICGIDPLIIYYCTGFKVNLFKSNLILWIPRSDARNLFLYPTESLRPLPIHQSMHYP